MKLELTLLAWSLRKMEEEEELREASSSKEMMKPRWSSSPASYSGDPPAKLRQGRGASMVEERRELSHGQE